MKLAFVFRQSPHGTAISREGLDALLAATAFCDEEDIAVFFMADGVLNLLANQQSDLILQKDIASAFKLLDLYDIGQRYICAESMDDFALSYDDLVINCEKIDRTLMLQKLQQAEKIITF
ncbi:sulfurtransferase complex subunit TusC [[Mannheimia] succiniciproducens]|uniref:DsrF protein n=1 Tax=Mannheimia succiniciproducens (strain KCTC 0769BP / MBEL55E) TaxID=221988 RepID=Q65W93_MANSM|nr:sulfurtransferase complex subunit TusC [[Mannheimia] succiniciproducens]AAU36767.1 DsrF protein [[Mannheimia] succiniciproducens MBEL55E]